MEIHFKVIGVALILLSLMHGGFYKYFNWGEELKKLSLVNRQMMVIHTCFIALGVCLMGLLCLFWSQELTQTELGKVISLGLGVFWSIRFFVQFVGYSSNLWKGKTFETFIHVVFSIFWLYVSVIFFWNGLT